MGRLCDIEETKNILILGGTYSTWQKQQKEKH